MDLKIVTDQDKAVYNQKVSHIIQSWEWGEFRKALGGEVLRYGLYHKNQLVQAFQITLHQIPLTGAKMGYLAKGPTPDKELADTLTEVSLKHHLAFIKVEPNILAKGKTSIDSRFHPSPKSYFTKHNYILDLTQPEETILKNMHQKTRYNIKVAQKHQVEIEERFDDQALEIYLDLYFATCQRQGFFGHNRAYHQKVWQILKDKGMARLLIAFYTPLGSSKRLPLVAWMLMNFQDTLYYPYGGSSVEYKNVMAANLVVWETIKLGKKMGLKKFDLWGAGDPAAGPSDPFYGFTRFKAGLGAELVEYLGTFDLVFNKLLYYPFTTIDQMTKLKVFLLKLSGR